MTSLVKTVTRVITLIGPEKEVDDELKHPFYAVGRYKQDETGVMRIVTTGGVTKHDPTKPHLIPKDWLKEE